MTKQIKGLSWGGPFFILSIVRKGLYGEGFSGWFRTRAHPFSHHPVLLLKKVITLIRLPEHPHCYLPDEKLHLER